MEVTIALPLSDDANAHRRAKATAHGLLKPEPDRGQVILLLPMDSDRLSDSRTHVSPQRPLRISQVRTDGADLWSGLQSLASSCNVSTACRLGRPVYPGSIRRLLAKTRLFDFAWAWMGQGIWSRWSRRLVPLTLPEAPIPDQGSIPLVRDSR